jgi:hypothetical protein
MTKLTLQKPNAEICGLRVLALLDRADPCYKTIEVLPDQWYPQRFILDILHEIEIRPNASQNLIYIGMGLINRDGPKEYPTLIEMLSELAYLEMQHSPYSLYTFIVEQIEERCIQVIDFTAWPHDLIYGMFWQLAAKYSDKADYTLLRNIMIDDKTGNEIGVYQFRW